ncbi:nitrilase [Metarhizium album ARSEF 1941]|uniref:Nitrilase n=1 Tax=Metarhizium album (strain ARSEF 1941) TaxID=1081103 RepID=A0A0B2WRD9_METAS|nr:nitrilase [Metarhizium album ARSEF 1941]KHN95545.1 nitrilase [Metarhizium album ARSEF 1941]
MRAVSVYAAGPEAPSSSPTSPQTRRLANAMVAPVTRVAACHVSPIFLSAKKTTQKAIGLIERAAAQKANLVVFPETYIPAFPVWSAVRAPTANHGFFRRMAEESIYAGGEEIREICAAAKASNVMVSLGFSEKVDFSSGTLYNSNLLISSEGEPLLHHRKLVPTFFEKLTWAPGDGHGLRVAATRFGKIGNLICGENTNPLARYALMAQGEQIHISTWPAVWPTTRAEGPARRRGADYDNVAANRIRAAGHCFEAKCYGVLCAGVLGEDAVDEVSGGSSHMRRVLRESQRGATMFLDPAGAELPGFTVDDETGVREPARLLQDAEGILYADLDVEDCIEGKQYHDVVGGYQRLDVFDLRVDTARKPPATFVSDGDAKLARVQDGGGGRG